MKASISRRAALKGATAIAASGLAASYVKANAPIRLGSIACLEGPLAAAGQDAYRCVQLMLEEADYKVAGRKIEWIKESSNGRPDVALARARKLVEQDGVDIVLGPLSGAEGLAVRDYSRTVESKTFLNGASGAQDTTLRNPSQNFFRFNSDGTQGVGGIAEYVKNTMKIDEITVIASDYATPYAMVFGFSLEYTRAGGKLNYFWTPFGTSDYSSLISQIPSTSGGLFAVFGGADALAFMTQYAQAGGKLPIVGGPMLADQDILSARGPHRKALIGTVLGTPAADWVDSSSWLDYVQRYRKRWLKEGGLQSPSMIGVCYLNNLQAMLLALKEVDGDVSGNQGRLREALAKVSFTNVIDSSVRLDHNRSAITDNFLCRVEEKDGRLQTVAFKRVTNVNQTLGFPEDKYLALGSPSRTNTGNVVL